MTTRPTERQTPDFYRLVSRWTSSDWLMVVLVAFTVATLCFNAATWGYHIGTDQLAGAWLNKFLLLAFVAAYLGVWVSDRLSRHPYRLRQPAGLTPWLVWPLIIVGLPMLAFYGGIGRATATTLPAVLGTALLIMSPIVVGGVLAKQQRWWSWPIFLGLIWILWQWAFIPNILETALISGGSDTWVVILLGVGTLGLVITLAEATLPWKSLTTPNRYLNITSYRAGWLSFTGTGSLIFSAYLALLRDKIFWLVFLLTISWELLGLANLGTLTNRAQLFIAVTLPLGLFAIVTLALSRSFYNQVRSLHQDLPLYPATSRLAAFVSGLTTVVGLGWLIDATLFGWPIASSWPLALMTTGAYSLAALVTVRPLAPSDQPVYRSAWLAVYQLIIFLFTFSLLSYFQTTDLLLTSLSLVALTIATLGYRHRPPSVTIE